jgi:hypothetical protein
MSKPSDFTDFPMGSVLSNYEHEQVACNIMVIMSRDRYNDWDPPTWPTYKMIRKQDGGFKMKERALFDKVLPYCKSEDTARLFSPVWARVKR